jgi:putative MATE family efflux protein
LTAHDNTGSGSEGLNKTLMRVALPIALQSLIGSSLNFVDNLMVGRLGETELASVGLSTQIFFVHWMLLFGFNGGVATFLAQFWGKRDLYNIRRTIGVAVSVCFFLSMCFFLPAVLIPERILGIFTDIPEVTAIGRDYIRTAAVCFLTVSVTVPFTVALRATGQTALPLKISAFAFCANTVLNYAFIFGNFGAPQLGVRGAALATAISRLLELSIMAAVVWREEHRRRQDKRLLRLEQGPLFPRGEQRPAHHAQ